MNFKEKVSFRLFLSSIFIISLTIFFVRITYPETHIKFIFDVIMVIFIITLFVYKKLEINLNLIIISIAPIISISLNEIFIHNNYLEKNNILNHYSFYHFYFAVLILIPTIIKNLNITIDKIYLTLLISCISSTILNTTLNIQLNFNRGEIATKIPALIIYDYTMVLITIIPLIYSILLKNKVSYLFLSISIINIFLIYLHGSRGVWLGIISLIFILTIFYIKSHLKKITYLLLLCFSLVTVSLIIPSSPISQRIHEFKNDKNMISNGEFVSNSTGIRVLMLKYSGKTFSENPFFGVGSNQIKNDILEMTKQNEHIHLHNIFTNELASHGLFGFVGIFILTIYPMILFSIRFKNKINKNISIIGICVTVFTIICGLTDYSFVRPYSLFCYFIIVIILLTYTSRSRAEIKN